MLDSTVWPDHLMNNYGTPPITIDHGEGCYLVDSEGRRHIDMLAGIAVNALGYGHPAIVDAVSAQLARGSHVSNLFASEPPLALASKLREIVGEDSSRVFFCNSGTEANEAAFKLARLTGRPTILAAEHGFHGRTMGSLALTGQPAKQAPFAPLPGGGEYYPYGDIDALRQRADLDQVAAIFLEPIQGETGVIPAPDGFLKAVRELCDEHGILMVCDEVQTGVGRTGTFFAYQHERGVIPDIITMAKGLGGGLPIGAVIARGAAAELFTPGIHGTTFGGNLAVCAAALAVLDVVNTPEFLESVRDKEQHLRTALEALDGVDHVRGRGLMLGVVLKQPCAKEAVTEGFNHGVILNAPADNVLRLTPPLIIDQQQCDAAIDAISTTLQTVQSATN